MNGTARFNWAYYRIYPGSLSKLDNGIEKIINPAKEFAKTKFQLNKWFFMRYMDITGAHLRLRFHVRDTDLKEFLERMDLVLQNGLGEVVNEKAVSLKRLVPYNQKDQTVMPRIKKDLYEPELIKYINNKYLKLSEELFFCYSELVCSVSSQLNQGEINRYEIGSLIMNHVFETICLQSNKLQIFLQDYFSYWSGSENMSYQLMTIAHQKKKIMESILSQDIHSYDYGEQINEYVHQLKFILLEVQDELGEDSFNHLLFHYTHMMNNRLGIWPIEEAYLSALMLQKLQGVVM